MRPLRLLLDSLVIVVFVAIGRSVHDHGVRLAGVASTAWPFLVGFALGWWWLLRQKKDGGDLLDGLTVSVATVAVGMVLRVLVGQGTAVAFIIVALVWNVGLMSAWRVLLAR